MPVIISHCGTLKSLQNSHGDTVLQLEAPSTTSLDKSTAWLLQWLHNCAPFHHLGMRRTNPEEEKEKNMQKYKKTRLVTRIFPVNSVPFQPSMDPCNDANQLCHNKNAGFQSCE